MAKVVSLVLCENIQPVISQNADGGYEVHPNIVSPFVTIHPVSIPGNYSFAIFVTIGGVDNSIQNKMQLKITAPNGSIVFSTGSLIVDPGSINNNSVSFSLDLRNFAFLQEGNYSIDILYNNEIIHNLDFSVERKEG